VADIVCHVVQLQRTAIFAVGCGDCGWNIGPLHEAITDRQSPEIIAQFSMLRRPSGSTQGIGLTCTFKATTC